MPPEKKKPQDSPIFNYFKEDKEKGENGSWICQAVVGKGAAEDGEDILCGVAVAKGGDNTTKGTRVGNLKRHLERCHPEILEELEKNEKKSQPQPGKIIINSITLGLIFFKITNPNFCSLVP